MATGAARRLAHCGGGSWGRRPSCRVAAGTVVRRAAAILVRALAAACQSAARLPLAFAVQDIVNCLTTGGAAVACRVADRGRGGS